jgi:predicted RNA-binding Zn-ribbon protein involved in translation (DUF1610 family)
MSSAGEVKTAGYELMLVLIRVLIFAALVVLVAGVGLLLRLPPAVAGGLAGVAGFAILVWMPFFEVTVTECPHCRTQVRTIENLGTFQCPSCKQYFKVEKKVKTNRMANHSLY